LFWIRARGRRIGFDIIFHTSSTVLSNKTNKICDLSNKLTVIIPGTPGIPAQCLVRVWSGRKLFIKKCFFCEYIHKSHLFWSRNTGTVPGVSDPGWPGRELDTGDVSGL
jgi:hypothetical protein